MDQQQHEMILEKAHPSGADEWYCPTCGRRLLMNYEPSFKKTVLEAGDEYAVHSGGKGGVSMQVSELALQEEQESKKDPRLSIWSDWMEQVHFDDWWNKED